MDPEKTNQTNSPEVTNVSEPQIVNNNEGHRLVVGLVFVVLILGLVWFFVYNKDKFKLLTKKSEVKMIQTSDVNRAKPVVTSGTGNLSIIWKQPGYRKCDISVSQDGSVVNGAVYFANGKIRADFGVSTTNTGDTTPSASMIFSGGDFYSWNNMTSTGFRSKLAGVTDPLAATGYGKYSTSNSAKYSCSDWSVDDSKFTTPENVKFTSTAK